MHFQLNFQAFKKAKFEGIEVMFWKYNEYLKERYGDYEIAPCCRQP